MLSVAKRIDREMMRFVLLGTSYVLATAEFFAFNVFLVVCWLVVGVLLVREHRRASEEGAGQDRRMC